VCWDIAKSRHVTNAPVSVILPTYKRADSLRGSLRKLLQCDPAPDQIVVHVDAGDEETPTMLAAEFPTVEVIRSDTQQGPGGGRNKLMAASRNETVVSLDDDSWPLQADFLGVADQMMSSATSIAAIACHIIEKDDRPEESNNSHNVAELKPTFSFVGCGAIIRRSAFLKTTGYIPLRYAYGMEEADVSIQLLDRGYEVVSCPNLSVFHDCPRETHHSSPSINAAQITNTGLFAFLRYPYRFWPYGCLQVINRIAFSLKKRRFRGVIQGLVSIPFHCLKYSQHRRAVTPSTMRLLLKMKRRSQG